MHDEPAGDHDGRPASPAGVRALVIVLLVCGLALAALPVTMLLRGGSEVGRIALQNASGETLRNVRVLRLVGGQERLVGSAHELAPDARTEISFDLGDVLSLRIEVDGATGHHEIPLLLAESIAHDAGTVVRIGPGGALTVTQDTLPSDDARADDVLVAPRDKHAIAVPADGEEAEVAGVTEIVTDEPVAADPDALARPLPEGWGEKWRPWFRHVAWEIGPEAGMEVAKATGKPMLLFYTATW